MSLVLATTTPGEPEIFASIQGEGASMGRPSTFVRLSRCNLACEWCDTAYTWRFEGDNRPHRDVIAYRREDNQVTLSEEKVAMRVAALGVQRVVITGGEPLLQGGSLARMVALLRALRPDTHIEIETNGSVAPHPSLDGMVHQYNVSPKLSHSGNPAALALPEDRLAAWAADPRAWFKFVVADPDDVDEVRRLQRRYAIPSARIFLMPEGRTSEVLRRRSEWLVELCTELGFSFSDRLHIHLFGDTRGT